MLNSPLPEPVKEPEVTKEPGTTDKTPEKGRQGRIFSIPQIPELKHQMQPPPLKSEITVLAVLRVDKLGSNFVELTARPLEVF